MTRAHLQSPRPLSSNTQLLLAAAIGLLIGVARLILVPRSGDFSWPICAARQWLAGNDPYGSICLGVRPDGRIWATNPFTTVLAVAPLSWLPDAWIAALLIGLSSGLLAYGLLERSPSPLALAVYGSVPFLQVFYFGQWAALLAAVAFLPALLPLTLVKPHIGLPIALTRLTWRRALACAAAVLVSLIILPDWPLRWLPQANSYDGFILALTPPGLLVIGLAALRWRDPDAWLVILAACVPQRDHYDGLILLAALRTGREWGAWTLLGWIGILARIALPGIPLSWMVALQTYLPASILILLRSPRVGAFIKGRTARAATRRLTIDQ